MAKTRQDRERVGLQWWSGRASRRVAAIEPAGGDAYRCVSISFKSGRIDSIKEQMAGPGDLAAVAAVAKGADQTVLIIPRRDLLFKWTRVPARDSRQIERMAPHEIRAASPPGRRRRRSRATRPSRRRRESIRSC